jgi:hypothetical protein
MIKGLNQSLSLNFNPLKNKDEGLHSARKIPGLQKMNSSMYFGGALGHSNLGNDSFFSGGRSVATSGGGLANKISLALSRVVWNITNNLINDDDEVNDLMQMIETLN